MFVLTVCGAAEGPEEGAWGCMGAGGESALEGGEVQGLRHTPSLEKTRAGQSVSGVVLGCLPQKLLQCFLKRQIPGSLPDPLSQKLLG